MELNALFYSWPKLATAKAWRRNAPEGFQSSVKENRLITHEMRLVRTRMLVEEFYRFAGILGPALGCFLFQFPRYRYTPSRLQSIVRQLDPQYRNAIEFRQPSWWRPSVYGRFVQRDLTFCTVSAPRLPDDLKIRDSGAREAWIYFDNDRNAFAIKNAHALIKALREMNAAVE